MSSPVSVTKDGSVPLLGASIDQLRAALDAGQTTSVELVAGYLNRIACYDRRGICLNSTPVLNEECFEEAAATDRARAQGTQRGASLDGIPFTVKDSFKVRGLTVAAGSPAFATLVAQDDSFAVQALRRHGAVVLGKTNMPPMAVGGCQRGLYGRAESPYNPDYLAGAWHSGSSSGSGVAVSASLCAFGLGEETVSSGRSPASNSGLVAYTPSRGLISIRGNWPLFPLRDTVVPHTRSVRDMLHILEALMSDDVDARGDLWQSQTVVSLPPVSSVRPSSMIGLAAPGAMAGCRLGVPKMYTNADGDAAEPISTRPSILKLFDDARRTLEELGAECVEVDLPVVSAYEKDRPGIKDLYDRGMLPAGWNEREINDLVSAAWDEFLRLNGDPSYPSLAVVNPWVIHADPPDAVDTRRQGKAHPGRDDIDYSRIVGRAREMGAAPTLEFAQLAQVLRGLERARHELFEQWLRDSQLDGIVFPANADVAPADADVNETSSAIAWRNGTVFSNMNHVMRHLGIPSTSVTMGVMPDTAMPVSLTFAGPAYSDCHLLRWAYDYENASCKRVDPSCVPDISFSTLATISSPLGLKSPSSATACPRLEVSVTGAGNIDLTGTALVQVKASATISTSPESAGGEGLEAQDESREWTLFLQVFIDGIESAAVQGKNASQAVEASGSVPAEERRRTRLSSSLVVVLATAVPAGGAGQAQRVAAGKFIKVPFRFP